METKYNQKVVEPDKQLTALTSEVHLSKNDQLTTKSIQDDVKNVKVHLDHNSTESFASKATSEDNKRKIEEFDVDKNYSNQGVEHCDQGMLNTEPGHHSGKDIQKTSTSTNLEHIFNESLKKLADEIVFLCEKCSYSTRELQNLKQHEIVHTVKAPFSCDECSYSGQSKDKLMRHKLTHIDEKKYFCDLCTYSCQRKDKLTRHKLIHSDEKKFSCDICKYSCQRKDKLMRHKLTHYREKDLYCDLCSYSCTRSDRLLLHKQLHPH